MNYIKPLDLHIKNFGPFLGEHHIKFAQSGLTLFKGTVTETGDGSGAGKSYALNALSYLYGGCPFAGTELQSWYTEESPSVSGRLQIGDQVITITRHNGLQISGDGYEQKIKGRAAEAELDRLFGMNEESRAIVTYRGQRRPGVFLNLSDSKKKEFLSSLLDLDKYDSIATEATEKASKLEQEMESLKVVKENASTTLLSAEASLTAVAAELVGFPDIDLTPVQENLNIAQQALSSIKSDIDKIKREDSQFLEAYVLKVRGKIKDVNARKEPAEIDWLQTQKSSLQKDLLSLKDKDSAARLDLEKVKSAYQSEIADLKSKDLVAQAAIEKQRAEINKKISDFNVALSKEARMGEDLEKAKEQEKHLASQTCPTCKQTWVGDSAKAEMEACRHTQEKCADFLSKIEKAKKAVEQLKNSLLSIKDISPNTEISVVQEKIKAVDAQIKAFVPNPEISVTEGKVKETTDRIKKEKDLFLDKKNCDIRELEVEESKFKDEFSKAFVEKTKGLQEKVAGLEKEIKDLTATEKEMGVILSQILVKEAVAEERTKQVEVIKTQLAEAESKLESIKGEFNLETDIAALFGKKGFLGVIFEDVLAEIASVANDIISRVANVRHLTVDFETEKKAATSGNIATRITPVIYNRGRRVSFSAGISGGMQAAVELAIDLAWGDVVSRRRGSYPGWLTLDETFHGLGGVAKESCLEMLQSYAGERLVLVVDHSSEFQGLFHNVIEIEQTDGKSRIA